jgi:hypothetical protein
MDAELYLDSFATHYQRQPPGREGWAWTACYRDEEPDEFDGLSFGFGATQLLAIADLMIRFPREV